MYFRCTAEKPQMPSPEGNQCCFSHFSHPSLPWDSTAAAPEPWLTGQTFSSYSLYPCDSSLFPWVELCFLKSTLQKAKSGFFPSSPKAIFKVNHTEGRWMMWKPSLAKPFSQVLSPTLAISSACAVALDTHRTLLSRKLVKEFRFMLCNNNQLHSKTCMEQIKMKTLLLSCQNLWQTKQPRNRILLVKMLQGAHVPELGA